MEYKVKDFKFGGATNSLRLKESCGNGQFFICKVCGHTEKVDDIFGHSREIGVVNRISAFLGEIQEQGQLRNLTADDLWSLTQFQLMRIYRSFTGKMPKNLPIEKGTNFSQG